jgi:diketogulonate reductase-like aldo/keto reductase
VVIPKSARRERIEENFDIGFKLSTEDVARLDQVKAGGG